MTTVLDAPPAPGPVLRLVGIPALTDAGSGGSDLGADSLSVEDLGSRIVGLAGRIAATTCQWLLLVGAFDARDGCARLGEGSW